MEETMKAGIDLAALLLLGLLGSASCLNAAQAKKDGTIEGVNEKFVGIMDPDKQVKKSDPLWERYFYAGKTQLERRDIAQAQKYYWAGAFALADWLAQNPGAKLNYVARFTLEDALAMSGDVMFQDADSSTVRDDPPAFPQEIQPADAAKIEAEQKRMSDEQSSFDTEHQTYDGGARLRMVHLRRRMDFAGPLLPLIARQLGTTDDLTKQLTLITMSDNSEFKDLSQQ
jgi:hypothetical protein